MQWLYEDGATPFLRAAQSGDVTLMKLLLAKGANPKLFTSTSVTPLMTAAGYGWVEGVTFEWSPEQSLEAVKMCLDLGIDPNIQEEDGRTALHSAAHKGRPEVVQLLVDRGADMQIHDKGSRDSVNGALLGHTWVPLDWARGHIADRPVLIASSSTPDQVAALQKKHGRDAAGHAIEQAMAAISERLVDAGVRRLVIAGGETSGAVVDRLGIPGFLVGAEIAPGVPVLRTVGWQRGEAVMALKSGNFGGLDFFNDAIRLMS